MPFRSRALTSTSHFWRTLHTSSALLALLRLLRDFNYRFRAFHAFSMAGFVSLLSTLHTFAIPPREILDCSFKVVSFHFGSCILIFLFHLVNILASWSTFAIPPSEKD